MALERGRGLTTLMQFCWLHDYTYVVKWTGLLSGGGERPGFGGWDGEGMSWIHGTSELYSGGGGGYCCEWEFCPLRSCVAQGPIVNSQNAEVNQ